MSLLAADGTALSARYWAPTDETGLKIAYLAGHGFTGSSSTEDVVRICSRFANRGRAVLALDFRGHGRSAGRSSLGDIEVRDLAAGAAFLRGRGAGAVAVVGWSMGASIAVRYAGLGGDADAVVSVSAPAYWYERETSPLRLIHWAVETRLGRIATRVVTRTRLGPVWTDPPASPVEVAGRIAPTPLLIVHGEQDRYFPVRHAEVLAAAAPHAQVWLEPGMGHAEAGTSVQLVDRIDDWVQSAVVS